MALYSFTPNTILDSAKVNSNFSALADGTELTTGIFDNASIWWEELGRTTLGSAGDTISVTGLTAKAFLMVIIRIQDTGGTVNGNITVNNDTSTNYSTRYSINGAADATATSASNFGLPGTTVANPFHSVMYINNIASDEKTFYAESVIAGTAGAGNAPQRAEVVAKWVNTSDQITRIDINNTGTGSYNTGSEMIVLGHD